MTEDKKIIKSDAVTEREGTIHNDLPPQNSEPEAVPKSKRMPKQVQRCLYCMKTVSEGYGIKICDKCAQKKKFAEYKSALHQLPLGTVLKGKYLVGRVLGEGGFGITYIGCDMTLDMRVAIKEYYPVGLSSRQSAMSLNVMSFTSAQDSFEKGKERFLNEARVMARLAKQNEIVSVMDYFEENNSAYIVMEYIDGTTLKSYAEQRGGRIPSKELFAMLEPMFGALQTVHDAGLIHRDISPDNLMIENGKLRLIDFGCARDVSENSETQTITLKHGYAPLEQYQRKGQGPWTDVYAFAASIYYCLTGQLPDRAVDRISEDNLIPPRKLHADISEQQEKAILLALGVKPTDRFQSMTEFHMSLYEGLTIKRYCTSCHKQIGDTAAYCRWCGKPVNEWVAKTANDKKPKLKLFGKKKQTEEAEIKPEDIPAFEEKVEKADIPEETIEESELSDTILDEAKVEETEPAEETEAEPESTEEVNSAERSELESTETAENAEETAEESTETTEESEEDVCTAKNADTDSVEE